MTKPAVGAAGFKNLVEATGQGVACRTHVAKRLGRQTPSGEEFEMHPKRKANPQTKRPKVKDRQLDAMVKAAWDEGWWAEKRPTGHVMCFHPGGKEKVLVNNTAGDRHTVQNVRSQLRKSGLKL